MMHSARALGRIEVCIEHGELDVELARTSGAVVAAGVCLSHLGMMCYSMGYYDLAIEYHARRLDLADEGLYAGRALVGNARANSRAKAHAGIGKAYYALGDEHQQDALVHFREQLAAANEMHLHEEQALSCSVRTSRAPRITL